MNKVTYELEMNTDRASLRRIIDILEYQYEILRTLRDDSFKGINGGASPHHKIKIEIKEAWI